MAKISLQASSSKVAIVLSSKILTALSGIIFVPVYISFLGEESYGLVAVYATLSGSLVVLDVGLSASVSRQVSHHRVFPEKRKEMKDLVFSVEVINWLIGLFAGAMIVLLSGLIASRWVSAKELPVDIITHCVMLMGLLFAIQFPSSVYDGVMIAAEKQVPNALINLCFVLLKAAGVILVLKFVSNTIIAFFIWQVVMTLLMTLSMRGFVWFKILKGGAKPVFSVQQLQTIKKFALGITGISLASFVLSYVDKIIVSKIVTLDFVGYYNLAFLLTGAITIFVSSVHQVVAPKLNTLVAKREEEKLVEFYHTVSKWIAIIILPVGLTLILFARDILFLWTRKEVLAENTYPILIAATTGVLLNALLYVSYMYMLAKGNTKFTLYQNIITILFFVPALLILADAKGAFGASLAWAGMNLGYLLISLPLFHRYFMKGEMLNWYVHDIGQPLLTAALIFGGARALQYYFIPGITLFGLIGWVILAFIVYALLTPEVRKMAKEYLSGRPIVIK